MPTDESTRRDDGVPLHVTRQLLKAVEEQRIPLEGFVQIVLEHVEGLCPHCRHELLRHREDRQRLAEEGPEAYFDAFRNLEAVLEAHSAEMAERTRRAAGLVAEVLAMPQGRRGKRVRGEIERFAEPLVARRLLDTARAVSAEQPATARSLAQCAHAICERLGRLGHLEKGVPDRGGMLVEACGLIGDAARRLGELEEARQFLRLAEATLVDEGATDPMVIGELESFRSRLARDEGRFEDAVHLEARAALVFTGLAEVELAAASAIRLAEIHYQAGDFRSAVQACERALRHLDRERDARLVLAARHTQTLCLLEMGELARASAHFLEDQPLYRLQAVEDDAWEQRHEWLSGRLLASGAPEKAVELLQSALLGLLRERKLVDVVLANLDLAEVFLQSGRLNDLEGLAAHLGALVRLEGVELAPEGVATLRRALATIGSGGATVGLLRETAATVRRQRRPGIRQPS